MPANYSSDFKRIHLEIISLQEQFDAKFATLDQLATTIGTIQSQVGAIQQRLDQPVANREPEVAKRKRG